MRFQDWLSTSQAKKTMRCCQRKSVFKLQNKFPHADMSWFTKKVEFDEKQTRKRPNSRPGRKGSKIRTKRVNLARGSWFWQFPLLADAEQNWEKPVPPLQVLAGCGTRSKINICHAHRVFHHKLQGNFHKRKNQTHNSKWAERVAGKVKHEILTTAVEFWALVRHHRLWYFTGRFVGQWSAAEFSAKSPFSVSRLF